MLPPEQGGLGLGPANTAAERARALGFEGEGTHGTKGDISSFDPASPYRGINTGATSAKNAVFVTDNPAVSNTYAETAVRRDILDIAKKAKERANAIEPFMGRIERKAFKTKATHKDIDKDIAVSNTYRPLKALALEFGDTSTNAPVRRSANMYWPPFVSQWNIPPHPEEIAFRQALMESPGDVVMPLKYNAGKSTAYDFGGKEWHSGPTRLSAAVDAAKAEGMDSVFFNNIYDPMRSYMGKEGVANNVALINPANIRSRFAAFNPLRRNETDLLASWLLPALGLGGLLGLGYSGQGEQTY
jgi:hypothetical protein